MPGIFEALPGIEAPVGAISNGLAQMWAGTASEGRPSPENEQATAIQVNLVLHLGFKTDAADAVRQFEIAVRFSRRYPCRVVVLCPLRDDAGVKEMRAKVYGECTVGRTKDDARCCEFVMLSYPRSARAFLESQVSICLSTDLPLYYWAHRFSDSAKLADYQYLLTTAKRVLFDSATAPADAVGYPWPRPENVRDLAFARLLPVRQAIGQFLSRYPAGALSGGLRSITLAHGADVVAEARVLFSWIKDRISDCGASGETFEIAQSQELAKTAFALSFAYGDKRFFRWKADLAAGHAAFDADFGAGRTTMPTTAALLPQENALSVAMFF
jgi:glucose-6-phosphate dehydrogenase assembly protein OpcA